MSFDLERAKKEGCILVQDFDIRDARIMTCDAERKNGDSILVLAKSLRFGVIAAFFKPDGTSTGGAYLKNKPQKLEVQIYKNNAGEILTTSSYGKPMEPNSDWTHLKTIEVEI